MMDETASRGDVKRINVESQRDNGKEVAVHFNISSPGWKPWNYVDFSRERNKTYLTAKNK